MQDMVDGKCPPGTTEVRPGRCRAPEFPPPSILDYKPRSTLVTEEHLVPKAKFPVIDIHSHTGPTAETIERLIGEMDAMGLQVLVNLSGGSTPDAVKQKVDFIRASRYPIASASSPTSSGTALAARAGPRRPWPTSKRAVKNGAIGLKIAKNLGLTAKKADGTRLKVDDPVLKPVWDACARLNIPVIIHTAEPKEFFSPLDYQNERWLELALFPDRRNYMPGQPTFDELQAERDRMFEANPKTRYIGAHFAYYGHDLPGAAALLDRLPNVVLEARRCSTSSAGSRARHATSSSSTRTGSCSARTRTSRASSRTTGGCSRRRRVLRLLPRLPRVLEALRHGPAGRGAEEGLLQERAARDAGAAADGWPE
jgi:uncharacterized protein